MNSFQESGPQELELPSLPGETFDSPYLWERARRFIFLRWLAIAGVLSALAYAGISGILEDPLPLFTVPIIMAGYNLLFLRTWKKTEAHPPRARIQRFLFLQFSLDLLALTLLIHWSGGVENPFFLFFFFPTVLAAIVLPQRQAIFLAFSASLLFGVLLFGENLGFLPHHPLNLGPSWTSTPFFRSFHASMGVFLAFFLSLFGIVCMVHNLAESRRRAVLRKWREERETLLKERLARLGELVGEVSHAILVPLHGTMNCLDLLKAQVDSGEGTDGETLSLLDEGLRKIDSVVKRLLYLGREAPLQKVPASLEALVDSAVKLVSPSAREREVSIEIVRNGKPPGPVLLDRERVTEVLVNLLQNALDASPPGSRVTVHLRCAALPSSVACIEVKDRGKGIPPSVLPRVFDPFFSTKAFGKGNGLGLAIARKVVEEHGGRIEIQSEETEGTRVLIFFPLPEKTWP